MKTGDSVIIQVDRGPELQARIDIASSQSTSIAVSVDEGIQYPFHIDKETGRQVLLLLDMRTEPGLYFDAMLPQRTVRVKLAT